MGRPHATGDGSGRRICLERQDLSEPLQGRLRHHRHTLERSQGSLACATNHIKDGAAMKAEPPNRFAARSTLAYPPTRGSIRTSTRSTPSTMPRKPISEARPMPAGRCCDPDTMTAASRAAPPTGRRCSGCWTTSATGKIDVIVVYKVDRLTRSLADFAKLVELFDAHGVSFVSVTQQFNTTTSMGRLTLNVLLSFAQFEREVTSERIRDKIAASKAQGTVGRRQGAARLRHQGSQDHRQRGGRRAGSHHIPQLPQARQHQSADG